MNTKVEISEQVLNFLRSLAPEPRRSIRLALRGLKDDRGDIKQREGDLADSFRLRVTSYRVILLDEQNVPDYSNRLVPQSASRHRVRFG
jgi:mRNA-degrading endonuclease RelE of RelBE toxin-antitoxin system